MPLFWIFQGDPRFGRIGETYGEDPTLASAMGVAYVKGIQKAEKSGKRLMATSKHFIGYHKADGGIHAANCDIPERLLRESIFKTFSGGYKKSEFEKCNDFI